MRYIGAMVAAMVLATSADAQTRPLTPQDSALLRALRLPTIIQEARRAGVPDSAVRVVIEDFRRRGVPAGDAEPAVREELEAVRAGAPREGFGEFVRAQLDRGVRGRELAEEIRAERARRGIGRPEARPQPGAQRRDTIDRGRRP